MKLLFSMLFAAVMAFSLQAVTVAWTLQNSAYIATDKTGKVSDWTGFTGDTVTDGGVTYNGVNLAVYVFFSTTNYSNDLAEAAAAATSGKLATYTMESATSTTDSTLSVYASGLNSKTESGSYHSGYYYMVVFEENKTAGAYAVAQTSYIEGGVDPNQGVYSNEAGGVPIEEQFVELNWVGGTWKDPQTAPEPTVMALLALGVAGLALRRKNA